MKARRKGTNESFVEIIEVSLADKPYVVYSADKIEFEQQQEPTQDHWQDLRERAAIAILQAMVTDKDFQHYSEQYKSEMAITYADALVEKLKGE